MEKIEVKKLSGENILEIIEEYSTNIYDAFNSSTKAVSEWYFSYTITEDYKNLKIEEKKKIFDHFNSISHLLENLDTYCFHNKVGEYIEN
ncbi:hypothetical protein [Chryseobacterium sp.]|uniref:hypothetical protein n=1 Tax=Chryseobacterium sp. TaxID=1871047 RepID=UPI0028A0F6CD|nr:hypothetical protein [Chryseobacterium sp.]